MATKYHIPIPQRDCDKPGVAQVANGRTEIYTQVFEVCSSSKTTPLPLFWDLSRQISWFPNRFLIPREWEPYIML